MIWALVGLLLPAGAVGVLLRALGIRTSADSRTLTIAIAFCAGLGLSSLGAFWWAVLWGGIGQWFVAADCLLWTTIGVAGGLRLAQTAPHSRVPQAHPSSTLAHHAARGMFALLVVIVAVAASAEYLDSPSGHMDATLMWNLKARFMTRGGADWTEFIHVPHANPSHPLLVSASVARLWAYAGAESTMAAAMVGAAAGAAIVATVVAGLGLRRAHAWIAGCVLIAPWAFSQSLVAQTADLPLALYVVVTLLVILPYREAGLRDMRRRLLLAGILAGLVAWTKNEGLVFLAIIFLIAAWVALRTGGVQQLAWFLAGAAPALVAIAWLKLALAPVPPEYFAGARLSMVGDALMDPTRHAHLIGLLWQHSLRWGGPAAVGTLPAAALAAGIVACTRGGLTARVALAVVGLMLAAYYTVWIVSPLNTEWLVGETFPRLLMQLWPSLVLAAFSYDVARSPLRADPLRKDSSEALRHR